EGQDSAGGEVVASGTEELDGVEAVQLRGLRVGHIENDGVECAGSCLEIVTAVGVVDVHARVGIQCGGLCGEKLPRHADERGVELDVVDALDGGMAERLGDAAV